MKKEKKKKSIFKRWWFWLIIILLVFGAFGSNGTNSSPSNPSEGPENALSTPASETLKIELIAGEQGDFGKEITMNADTEFEERFYAYYVPAGTYSAKNVGDYPAQITVYAGFAKGDSGWDEYTEIGDAVVVNVGESVTIKVPDEWFIEIHEPAHFMLEEQPASEPAK